MIDYNMIKSEVSNLARELDRYKDNDLSHKDMIAVSDLLAETVMMIRRKYGITSLYYMVSEEKAMQGIGTDRLNTREGEWIEDPSGPPGWYLCDGCRKLSTSHKIRFCQNCGRRMKNGK